METAALRFRINVLGALALAAYLALVLLSYVQAPALWRSRKDVPQANAFFDSLAESVPPVGLYRLFDGNAAVIISYFIPLALATLAAALLILLLRRRGDAADGAIVALLGRWSLAFAAVCFFAYPLFTQDFWLSAAWGRMVAAGDNPYYRFFTPDSVAGLPLDHFPMMMSYGPGWAVLSGAVMAVAGKSLIATALLFKALLAAAWVATIVLVAKVTAARPVRERCLAAAAIGWVPLGATQTLAEGHNDIAMAVFALLWIHLLLRGRLLAPLALAASILSKYVTGPLVVVDAIAALRMHRLSWRQFLVRLVAPALFGLAVFAVFYRSLAFFDGTRLVNEWRFLLPKDALGALEDLLGFSLFPAEYVIAAAFAALAAWSLYALVRAATPDQVVKTSLAILCAISFAAIAHIWPWYLVWTIAFAALLPAWWLSRFVVGVSLLAPFALAVWWVEDLGDYAEWAALVMYAGALLWTALTREPAARAASAPARSEAKPAESAGRS